MCEEEIQDLLHQNMHFNIVFSTGQTDFTNESGSSSDDTNDTCDANDNNNTDDAKQNKQNNKAFKKNQRVRVKHPEWEKHYIGKIKNIRQTKSNPAYSKYDIELDDEGFELQKNIKKMEIKRPTFSFTNKVNVIFF